LREVKVRLFVFSEKPDKSDFRAFGPIPTFSFDIVLRAALPNRPFVLPAASLPGQCRRCGTEQSSRLFLLRQLHSIAAGEKIRRHSETKA
jgi:hypothetical protein